MKIFITGGTGFIGSHLVNALAAQGHILYLLVRDRQKAADFTDKNNIVLIEGAIEEVDSYRQIFAEPMDLVYHLAAISGQKWGAGEEEYYRINVRGTEDLLEVCQGKTGRVIFFSSNKAHSNNGFLREPYGKSKWQAEQMVATAGKSGLAAINLRPAVVYGPGAVEGMILKLCQLVQQGKFFRIGSGKNVIPLIYVDDLIDALIRAGNSQTAGEIYEIIGPDLPTFGEVIEVIARYLEVKPNKFSVPLPLARAAAGFSEFIFGILHREPLLTQHRVDAVTSHRPHLNSQKAERELGYSARVTFQQGIAPTIDWYRQHGYL